MGNYKKSEITKERITETAATLFLENGYYAVSIKSICDASHLSVSRINYHFQTKAGLAEHICRIFLRNFYGQIKNVISYDEDYSLVAEIVQIRFFISLFANNGENRNYQKFYNDIAREGIWAVAFRDFAMDRFLAARNSTYCADNLLSDEVLRYRSRIFAVALPAIFAENGQTNSDIPILPEEQIQTMRSVFSTLFMQLLDIPHNIQEEIEQRAIRYEKAIHVEITSLTDVQITLHIEDIQA